MKSLSKFFVDEFFVLIDDEKAKVYQIVGKNSNTTSAREVMLRKVYNGISVCYATKNVHTFHHSNVLVYPIYWS